MDKTLRKAILVASVSWPLASSAGGLYMYEIGTSDLGFAAAGTAGRAEHASTVFANPAGMTRLAGNQMTLGAQALYGDVEYELDGQGALAGSDPGNVIGWFPGGSAFYSHSVSDRFNAEFKRRQALHRDAEASAMKDVAEFIDKAHEIYGYDHFLNDAGGSICEIDDPEMLRVLDAHTLILYLRAGPDMEQALIRRAAENPKPLYYREDFLDQHLAQYLQLENLSSPDQVEPDRFVRWIFPHLVRHRIPRYQAIAERYGYTVDARDLETVRDEGDFVELVAGAMDRKGTGKRV